MTGSRTEGAPVSPNRGFSLLEAVTALFLVALMTGVLVPMASSFMDANRSLETSDQLKRIHRAIFGDRGQGTYGYLGDVGAFPSSLMDLLRKPASNPPGWNGPYLRNAQVVDGRLYDGFGSPIECYYKRNSDQATTAVADQFVLISRGPDRTSTNTSATPNQCSTFTGTLPSNNAWVTAAANLDNVVYPDFRRNAGLLDAPYVGRLSISIFNYDQNGSVDAIVPGCPHFYTITVTSVPRGTSDTFSMPFNPGGNAVDLRQGHYRVRITSPAALGALWEEVVAVGPATSQFREVRLGGLLDTSTTPEHTLEVVNGYNFTSGNNRIRITQLTAATNVGTVDYGFTDSWNDVESCIPINARQNNATGEIVDSFTMPYLAGTYSRRINKNALYSITFVNRNTGNAAAKQQLFVYESGLLVGVVSSHGKFKVKTLRNLKAGNPYTVYNKTGALVASGTVPFANGTVYIP